MSGKAPLRDTLSTIFLRRPYVCPSCSSKRTLSTRAKPLASGVAKQGFSSPTPAFPPFRRSTPIRHASTSGSITAVNVPRSTPPSFRKLDQALSNLEKEAAVYVNISQLRLALRGLESGNSVTRVAILGIDSQQGAARLTRALLADPLAPEPTWEKYLIDLDNGDGKAILLRYGKKFKVDRGHPLVKTFFVPSSILHSHNLEILVQGVSTSDGFADASSLLVPSLETPGSYGGRMSIVTYPVHKVLIYTNGLGALPAIGDAQYMGSMIQRVVDGSWSALQPSGGQAPSIIPVNLSLGEVAIETFRKSLERSIEFEHAWFDSGMPSVASWLTEGTDASSETLKPSVRRLVELVSTNTAQAIQTEENTQLQEARDKEIPMSTKDIMNQGISVWAENAHTELRDRLISAFVSRSWRKTKWWKLFWRVDEVGFVASDILNRAWLVDAEKEMIWISGRIQQSGLLVPLKSAAPLRPPGSNEVNTSLFGGTKTPSVADLMDDIKPFEPDDEEPLVLHPWPQNISFARSALSRTTIPPLQALSQTLMLQTVSTTFLTSTLSALVYFGVSSTSFYEAGTVAALGLVFSLRRLQKRWEAAREQWKSVVREDGREVLRREEHLLRDTVKHGGEVRFDFAAVEQRRVASEALQKVQDALHEVSGDRSGS